MSIRVLMFGWEFAPVIAGGLGVVCRSLVEQLLSTDTQVTYVIPKLPKQINVDNLKLINASRIKVRKDLAKFISITTPLTPYLSVLDYQQLPGYFFEVQETFHNGEVYGTDLFEELNRYAFQGEHIAQEEDFDVIHAHDWMTFRAAIKAKAISGKPFVAHIHATEYERSANMPNPEILAYEREGLEAADLIIAVSNKTKDIISNNYQIDPNKIRVVHNAVDITNKTRVGLEKKEGERIVLFLGRLAVSKGTDYLMEAAYKVIEKYENVKFVFVGKGNMMEYLINRSIELGIAKNVVFTGFMPNHEVDKAYRMADLFVMPSVLEPFGITALEAMRNGVPVLMSKQSGASEVVPNSLKVDYWDIDEMANKILAVLQFNPLSQTLVEHGYNDLDKLSWENQAEEVKKIYLEAISK